jgi:hypothetical protein
MRVAYYALHYGKEYLAWSIASIQKAVDQIHIFYTATPSYGQRTPGFVCPDTEDELQAEAQRFATVPIVWHRGQWGSEGAHRSAIYSVQGVEQALVVDADEVWLPGAAEAALEAAQHLEAGCVGLPFVHFWRSFHWVCRDHWMPIRVLNFGKPQGSTEFLHDVTPVLHFGYAQSLALMLYKWSCHGHLAELRPNWIDRFRDWRPGDPGDVHPTTYNIWTPQSTDASVLDPLLADHPYRHMELIG